MNTDLNRRDVVSTILRDAVATLEVSTAPMPTAPMPDADAVRRGALDAILAAADELAQGAEGASDVLQFPTPVALTCRKVPHFGDGYLHAAEDDSPYDVDGHPHCGRCHVALPHAERLDEGPSDSDMLNWVVENLIEKRAVTGGGVAVHWVDADGEDHWTKGKDVREAIRNAMRESAANEEASEANT